jgi:hypothetical protein
MSLPHSSAQIKVRQPIRDSAFSPTLNVPKGAEQKQKEIHQ